MFNFLHTFQPQPILLSFGPIAIYWYGFFIVLGITAALLVTFKLAKYYKISNDTVFDLAFWLIIGGIIGARLYDIGLNLPYYFNHPLQTLKIWQGGLAIHGAIISGLIIVWLFTHRYKINFWKLTALFVPGLALAQAIGRWGNYFNQELFGLPTAQPWGIPINLLNRPLNYLSFEYFQPTFLYESLGCLVIFLFLLIINIYYIKEKKLGDKFYIWSVALYMILYSILRFTLEFIRLDETPTVFSLRWPQIISLIIIIISVLILIFKTHAASTKN
jgi:phosphatidylglycerol:prolipoprotein diacylglycerol transferase